MTGEFLQPRPKPDKVVMFDHVTKGSNIADVARDAAETALVEGAERVLFIFNDQPHEVTHAQAAQMLSPDNLHRDITSLEERVTALQKAIVDTRNRIAKEKEFGKKIYGPNF